MAWSRRRFAILACVVGAATLAIGIGVATGAKLKTKSNTVEVDSLDYGSPTAKCKRGTKAVSGGFEVERGLGDPGDPSFFGAEQSSRTGSRSWTTKALNLGDDSGDLTSYAYCRDQKLKRRSASVSIEPGEIESATARCPRGTKAFSGGFAGDEFDVVGGTGPWFWPVQSMKQGKREWTVSAFNANDEDELTAFVYCHEGKSLKTKRAEESVGTQEFETVEARCSRKQRVVSGGFDTDSDWAMTGTWVMESRKVGKRTWKVAGQDAGGLPHDLTAYAYCEKKQAN